MMNSCEQTSLVNLTPKVYKRRWYVLCMLSLISCLLNGVWASWGPIAQSAKIVFDWTDTTIFMLVNSGNIALILLIVPGMWLLQGKGLRLSFVVCSVVLTIATGVRCITSDPKIATRLIFLGQSLNGAANYVAFAGPSLLSEVWFPHNQRTTATAVSLLFSSVGAALAFVVGPQIVPQPVIYNYTIYNYTNASHDSLNSEEDVVEKNATGIANEAEMRDRIMIFNYLQFGFALLIMVVSVIYFPDKPPTPPSATAAVNRTDFSTSIKQILRSVPFWHIAVIYGFSTGVFGVASSTLDVYLDHLGISQGDAGWLGFYGGVGATLTGILLSRFTDMFLKHMKLYLVIVYFLSTLFFIWFSLMVNSYIYFSEGLLYVAYIGGSLMLIGAMPLFYEISCEAAYPISEGVTAGFLTLMQNLGGTLVLLISLVPNIGTAWINWCLVSSVGLSAIGLILYKENYRRTNIDIVIKEPG